MTIGNGHIGGNGHHGAVAPNNGMGAPPDTIEEVSYDHRAPFEQRLAVSWKQRLKHLVQRIVWIFLGAAGMVAAMARSGSKRTPLRPGAPRIRRILVVRVDLIGDLVLSLPAVRALHRAYPDAEIDMLVRPSTAGVLAGQPDVTRIITYEPNVWRRPTSLIKPRNWAGALRLIETLRATHYDLCVSISGDWASVLAWTSGARRRVGYAGEAYQGLLTDAVPGGRYTVRQHEIEYVRALARAAGGICANDDLPRLHVEPGAATGIQRTLERAGIAGGNRPLVVLHPGAQNGMAKRWPTESWAALADLLVAQLGARIVLTGVPGDAAISGAIVRRARQRIADLTGRTSLPELIALLAHCDVLVSGDSGPLHIASALDTPVVGLYGPTDPAISGPLGPNAIVLRRRIWCGPCYDARATADCRFSNPVCMKGISPEMTLAAVRRQLLRHRSDTILARNLSMDGEHVEPSDSHWLAAP